MPFTPIHLGVGALGKAALGRNFSFVVFGATQVAMDIEPLLALTGVIDGQVHGVTHSWPGALVVGMLVWAAWQASARWPGDLFGDWRRIPPAVVMLSAVMGAITHLVLDAMMHADMAIALVSVMPDIPNPDNPARPYRFSESVCAAALIISPVVWGVRALSARLVRQLDRQVVDDNIPRF